MVKRFRLSEFLGFLCAVFFLLSKIISPEFGFVLFALSTVILPIVLICVRIKGFLPSILIRILLPLLYLNYVGSDIISYGLDVPNVLYSKYEYIEGRPQNLQIEYKNRSQRFSIDGVKFKIERDIAKLDMDKVYEITYLPNSKYVINIREVKSFW